MNDNVRQTIECKAHGTRTAAIVCGHMLAPMGRSVGFVIYGLSNDEREKRCHIGPDVCTLDRERFFLRGLIPIPVSGRPERSITTILSLRP